MKGNYLRKPVEELLDIYSNAVRYYVENRITPGDMHIEDFATEIANFSECFYATIQALPKDN